MIGSSTFHSGYHPLLSNTYQTPAIGGSALRHPHLPESYLHLHPSSHGSLRSAKHPNIRYSQPPRSPNNIFSIFDPLGIFTGMETPQPPQPQRALAKKKGEAAVYATEAPPPMVYFPEGGSGACEDFSPSGFNTYSFLSFLFSVANLVGLIANNVNNNLNNNNNNNNDNNNNLGNINVANSNSAQNNQNNVDIPAAIGRRKRRQVDVEVDKSNNKSKNFEVEDQETTAIVVMDFIRGLRSAMLISEPSCALRNMCEVNSAAVKRGLSAAVIAEVFTVALVDMYPRALPSTRNALLVAGSKGRKNISCLKAYSSCPDTLWQHHNIDFGLEDLMNQLTLEELTKELGLENLADLLRVPSFSSGVFK